ncbi:MAG: hypothetical protein JXM71_08845, partial [Spirochaetales bacterium]|nr:hypothetical protein [Spirochaetales bacterium]
DLLSYMEPGLEGAESWLAAYYASEGDEAGFAMESLFATALGDEESVWELATAMARVEANAVASLGELAGYLQSTRVAMSGASVVAERFIATSIAMALSEESLYHWVIGALGITEEDGLEQFVGATTVDAEAEAYLGLVISPYAELAASFYLARLAMEGDKPAFEAAAIRVETSVESRGRRVLTLVEVGARFIGGFSGDPLLWAMDRSEDAGVDALALTRYLETRRFDDSIASQLGRGVETGAATDPFLRWVVQGASGIAERLLQEAGTSARMLELSLSYEAAMAGALDAEQTGVRHWREYLDDASLALAISRAGSFANAPSPALAGAPEDEPCRAPAAAASFREGLLADAVEESYRRARSLEVAVQSWAESGVDAGYASFIAACDRYSIDPQTIFVEADTPTISALKIADWQAAAEAYATSATRRAISRAEFARRGRVCALMADGGATSSGLDDMREGISRANEAYDESMAVYEEKATILKNAEVRYDDAYEYMRSVYVELEAAKTSYEREDTIHRWASSAYLTASGDDGVRAAYRSPTAELARAEAALLRAVEAREALASMYDSSATSRAYDDAEYNLAYAAYDEQRRLTLVVARAREALSGSLSEQYSINANAYDAYSRSREALLSGNALESSMHGYLSVSTDGSLRLSYDSGFNFADGSSDEMIDDYFNVSLDLESESIERETAFSKTVDNVAAWMSGQSFDAAKVRQWGLARDYVLSRLVSSEPEFGTLLDYRESVISEDLLGSKRFTLLGKTIAEILEDYRGGTLESLRQDAYTSMGAEEKRVFDSYLALQVTGLARKPLAPSSDESGTYDAFSYWSSREEYKAIDAAALKTIEELQENTKVAAISYAGYLAAAVVAGLFIFTAFTVPAFLASAGMAFAAMVGFGLSIAGVESTRDTYEAAMNDLFSQTDASVGSMTAGMAEMVRLREDYLDSCTTLTKLEGAASDGLPWNTSMFRNALAASGGMADADIDTLAGYLDAQSVEGLPEPANAVEAINYLYALARRQTDDSLAALELVHADDEARRVAAEASYQETYIRFIEGHADASMLGIAAMAAYGSEASSRKEHARKLVSGLRESLDSDEQGALVQERADSARLVASLTNRMTRIRHETSLAALEADWDIARTDLYSKRLAWAEAGELILAAGRSDFDDGFELIRDGATSWSRSYSDEYEQKIQAWDDTYALMLDEKLEWVASATRAADLASTGAMLALVSSDAERLARRIDTMSVSTINLADKALETYHKALAGSAIASMKDSLGAWGMMGTGSIAVQQARAFGAAAWDSGTIRAQADRFAMDSRAELESAQARQLVSKVRQSVTEVVSGLDDSVRAANSGFEAGMNKVFVAGGAWQRSGETYSKDVVVHSTVSSPYISERVTVPAYLRYEVEPWNLATDLSDGTVAVLGADAIHALLAKVQDEVSLKAASIFGSEDERSEAAAEARTFSFDVYRQDKVVVGSKKLSWVDGRGETRYREVDVYGMVDVLDHTEERTTGAGLFGTHIGYAPVVAHNVDPDAGQDAA